MYTFIHEKLCFLQAPEDTQVLDQAPVVAC